MPKIGNLEGGRVVRRGGVMGRVVKVRLNLIHAPALSDKSRLERKRYGIWLRRRRRVSLGRRRKEVVMPRFCGRWLGVRLRFLGGSLGGFVAEMFLGCEVKGGGSWRGGERGVACARSFERYVPSHVGAGGCAGKSARSSPRGPSPEHRCP